MADENEAISKETLELLEYRLERKVRQDFLKTVAIPLGGGGAFAIVLAVLVWIPSQIREFFEKKAVQDQIEITIQKNTEKYFSDGTVQKIIADRVQLQVSKLVDAQLPVEVAKAVNIAVTNFFAAAEGKQLLTQTMGASLETQFRSDEMQNRLRTMVTDYLKGDGRPVIADAINKELKPISQALGKSVFKNKDKLVSQLEQQSLQGEPKLSLEHLRRFLEADNVRTIQKKGLPVILTKEIRAGYQYDRNVIEDYLQGFRRAFGNQFRYVGIFYGPKKHFVALVDSRDFEKRIRENQGRVVLELLNSEDHLTESQAEERLAALFGVNAVKRVRADQTVAEVLRNPLYWTAPEKLDDWMAVVDDQQRLFATTSRGQLIKGLMDSPL